MALCSDLEAKLREERAAAEQLAKALCRVATATTYEQREHVEAAVSAVAQPAPIAGDYEPLPSPAIPQQMPLELIEPTASAATNGAGYENGVQAALDLQVALDGDQDYHAVRGLLAERRVLTDGDVQAALGVAASTARALLHRLVDQGLSTQEGIRRGTRYVQVL